MTETPKVPPHIELVFKDAAENIFFIKKQEWIIVGYAIAVDVGAITISQQFKNYLLLQICLSAGAVAAAIYGIAVLRIFSVGLAKWRLRLQWIYENHFSKEEQQALKLGKRNKWNEWVIMGGLKVTLLVAAVAALLAIWHPRPGKASFFHLEICQTGN